MIKVDEISNLVSLFNKLVSYASLGEAWWLTTDGKDIKLEDKYHESFARKELARLDIDNEGLGTTVFLRLGNIRIRFIDNTVNYLALKGEACNSIQENFPRDCLHFRKNR